VAIDPAHLRQHLQWAAGAYGLDLVLPIGRTEPRAARPAPLLAPAPAEVLASEAPPTAAPRAVAPARAPAPVVAAVPAPPPSPPTEPPPPATDDLAAATEALRQLRTEVMPCTRCKLHEQRQHVVFGEGNPRARVMFIGEAPGATEDQTGRPFVGPAGQLLDRILAGAMGLQRSEVFIANVNKCRPPGNREPAPDEVAACLPYLQQQVAIVRPEVIVCLGRVAAQNLLGTTQSASALRGRELDYRGVPVVVTWHPAYLLREPSRKRETWDDIKRVNRLLGRPEVPPPPAVS
jgi:uracil-DNA glycosylase